MPKSICNSRMSYNNEIWIISIINWGSKIGGHCVLLVEGAEENGTNFIGEYHICVEQEPSTQQEKESFFNKHINKYGIIKEIKINEDDHYYENHIASYVKLSSRSYAVEPMLARKMISSIYADAKQCEENNYIKYQFLGDRHPLATKLAGINCAEWCRLKLLEAKVDVNAIFDKPKSLTSACSIL
jgi:hypothetical protein